MNTKGLLAGWAVLIAVGLSLFGVSVATDQPPPKPDLPDKVVLSQETKQLADLLSGQQQILDTLTDHSDRLLALEKTLEGNKKDTPTPPPEETPPEIVEPPPEPAKQTQPVIDGYSEAIRILDSYNGRPWHVVGRRGDAAHLRRHLADHGLPSIGLQNLSNGQLERVHGAMHQQHPSASMYAKDPNDRRFLRIRPSVRVQTPRFNFQMNCPNGRCRIK